MNTGIQILKVWLKSGQHLLKYKFFLWDCFFIGASCRACRNVCWNDSHKVCFISNDAALITLPYYRPSTSECSWNNRGRIVDAGCTSYVLKSGSQNRISPKLHEVYIWLPINLLKSKLRYSSPFRNASVPNEGRSSNCGGVATKIPHSPFLNSRFTSRPYYRGPRCVAMYNVANITYTCNDVCSSCGDVARRRRKDVANRLQTSLNDDDDVGKLH